MPLCAISPVNSSSGIAAVSDGWLVIVVDMMKWRGAFWVAPSCYGRKWLWWTSEVLTEVQRIAAHLPALLSLRHKQSTLTKSPHHHHFPLHLIPPFRRRFPSVIFALLSSILQPGHAQCSPRLRRPDSLPSAPLPPPPSFMPAFQQAPPLANTPSPPPSQLFPPHPPISLHQGWLLPLQTHLSMHLFLILSLSFHHRVPSVFLNPSRPWKTDATALTPSGDGAGGWGGGRGWGGLHH